MGKIIRIKPLLVLGGLLFFMYLVFECVGFRGRVLDCSTDLPVPGVEVSFLTEDGTLAARVVTDQGGCYRLSLARGRYQVKASHSDYTLYSSAPSFYVVSGSGYDACNIFLKRQDDSP